MFQVFEVHSSEAPLCSADKPPRKRKRKRVEFSECDHTNELRSMWTYLEGLAAQFGVLEKVTQIRDHQDSVTYKTALAGAAVISHNDPVLEEGRKSKSQLPVSAILTTVVTSIPLSCVQLYSVFSEGRPIPSAYQKFLYQWTQDSQEHHQSDLLPSV